MRVEKLETWAGPGQAEALLAAQRELRAQSAGLRAQLLRVERVQDRHSVLLAGLKQDVSGLKPDVAVLKEDMSEVKSALGEILRRLPPPAA